MPQSIVPNLLSNLRAQNISTGADTLGFTDYKIEKGSFSIAGLPEENYIVDYEKAILIWKIKPGSDSVSISYRVLPFKQEHVYQRKNARLIDSNFAFVYAPQAGSSNSPSFVDFNKLQYSGSYGRGISLGNNQDVVLNSNFNLQLSGYLLDSIKIDAAMTDNTIPIQPEGNTQRLQEFDQIFIHLQKDKTHLFLGDINLDKPNSYFLNYTKRVQGISFKTEQKLSDAVSNITSVSGSIAKGQFARNIFEGEEGNQGPYKLSGNNGEQYFIILAGTEKVYIDNVLMERGENADYIINYNTGELRFMPRKLISKDSRIQVEFDYQDRNYLNSLISLYNETKLNNKWSVKVNVYSNQDAKNQPYLQNLSPDQKRFLATVGDSIQNAYYPVYNPDTFSASKILYELKDTVVNGITYDSVLVYSTDSTRNLYNVSFSYVGAQKGDYTISANNTNGRSYVWVAPENGIPSGDYAAVQILITPKKTQVFTLGTTYNIDSLKSLDIEFAGSNYNPNLFSDHKNPDHWGLAGRVSYKEERHLGTKDSLHQTKWKWNNSIYHEYVQARFRAIAPYRNVEFARDWNVDYGSSGADENLSNLSTSLNNKKLGTLQYSLTNYSKTQLYNGLQNKLIYTYNGKNLQVGATYNLVQSKDTLFSSAYFRPVLFANYNFRKKIDAAIGIRYESEHNPLRNYRADTLSNKAFAFDIYTLYLKFNDNKPITSLLQYRRRDDKLPYQNRLLAQSHSHNIDWSFSIARLRNQVINFTGTYRNLQIDNAQINNQVAEQSLVGRLDYNAQFLKNVINWTTLYEFGSGQEQKRSYTFVEVVAGQGLYTWIDYNNDGVQQNNEFEIALYADQKKFVKVFTPTNEYVKVNYVNFNQSLILEPANYWLQNSSKSRFAKTISRFSNQTAVQIGNRLLSDMGMASYNPFIQSLANENIIFTNTTINNSSYFNRTSSYWGIEYNYLQNIGKQLLTYGVEGSGQVQHLYKLRANISRSFTFNLSARHGNRTYTSALSNDNRSYHINITNAEPALSWIHQSRFRITGSYRYEERVNLVRFGGEKALSGSANLEMRWSQANSGNILVKATYSGIRFTGQETASAAYIMLDGLKNGNNFLWYVNWDRRIGSGLELSLEYEGRKAGDTKTVHTGRMTIRALF